MTDEFDEFHRRAVRVIDDLHVAVSRFDFATEANEVRGALHGTSADRTLFYASDAAVHRSVAALLRTLDPQPFYASTRALLIRLQKPAVRGRVVGRLWQRLRRHGAAADGRTYLNTATGDITAADAERYLDHATSDLEGGVSRIGNDKALSRFRNREIAHAAIEMKGCDPTFGDPAGAIDVAADMQRTLRFLILGAPLDADALREGLRREHRATLRAIAAGIAGEGRSITAAPERFSEGG